MAGPEPKVSDAEVLRLVALVPRPFVTAGDLVEKMEMTRPGVVNRLNSLAEEGYLDSKMVGGAAKVYWLTQEGRELASEAESLSDGSQ